MNIDAIKNGIVIDHIKAGKSMEIYDYLSLGELDCTVAVIKNVVSKKMGKKDIIKIDSEFDIDFNILGVIDPNITVNIIKDGVRIAKESPQLPKEITNVVKCKNPRCITSTEQEIPHIFRLTDKKEGVYRCIYCESKAKSEQ